MSYEINNMIALNIPPNSAHIFEITLGRRMSSERDKHQHDFNIVKLSC